MDDRADTERLKRLFGPALEKAEAAGITLVLEDEAHDSTKNPEEMLRITEAMESEYFKVNYDAVNFFQASYEGFPYAYEVLKEKIAYIHIKDGCRYVPEHGHNTDALGGGMSGANGGQFIYYPMMGSGLLNIFGLLRRIKDDGYRGVVHFGTPYDAGTLAYLYTIGNYLFESGDGFYSIKRSGWILSSIWTMGEMIVEIMRPREDMPLDAPGEFRGPYPSGAPAIFADTAAKMGKNAGIIGGVGKDDFGKCILDRLTGHGVNCEFVKQVEGCSTGVAFVTYFSNGDRKFIFHIGNTPAVRAESPDISGIETPAFFHLMGCSLTADETFYEEIIRTLYKFLDRAARISFDPQYPSGTDRQALHERIHRSDP